MTNKKTIGILITSSIIGILASAIYQRFYDLFFYSVFLGTITTTASAYIFLRVFTQKVKDLNIQKFLLTSTASLLTFSFLSTIPLTLDRSYSVWILKSLRNYEIQDQRVTEEKIIENSVVFFSPAQKELDRRLYEQLKIGNIAKTKNGEIILTNKGRLIAEVNSLIGAIYELNPKYTKLDK